MSKRSQEKRITPGARTLKFLREQANHSVRSASLASGVGSGVINHLENGRIQIREHHLEKLLKAYGVNHQAYDMFANGSVKLPQKLRNDCIELIRQMTLDQLTTAFPVLNSLAAHK